jgi:hypothetical protein
MRLGHRFAIRAGAGDGVNHTPDDAWLLLLASKAEYSEEREVGYRTIEAAGATITTTALNRPVTADHSAIVAGASALKPRDLQGGGVK